MIDGADKHIGLDQLRNVRLLVVSAIHRKRRLAIAPGEFRGSQRLDGVLGNGDEFPLQRFAILDD
jgi:hypothetical protein